MSETSRKIGAFANFSLAVGIIATIVSAIGYHSDRAHFLQSYLWTYNYWLGVSLGALGFRLLYQLVGGHWGRAVRKFMEAFTATLPLMTVLFIPIALHFSEFYPWGKAGTMEEAVLRHQAAFLSVHFVLGRAAFYFASWLICWLLLRSWTRGVDAGSSRLKGLGGFGLVMLFLTSSFAAVDWIMSLETGWYSSIYGGIVLMGQGLTAMALMIALLTLWAPQTEDSITPTDFNDLGNLMLAFTLLWTYTQVSQLIIIWSGNLPEEISWYIRRTTGGWKPISVFVGLFQFAVVFACLLNKELKRHRRSLRTVALGVLAIYVVNMFWLVLPSMRPNIYVHWLDAALFFAIGGLWLAVMSYSLKNEDLLEWYKHGTY